eukprot:gnl/TRDRNA2_/TRDRNA2_40091_c0_seq1.p1 gnl/TRDRNA2_/TRDRNA2_40091_c0~~gnl/TRDRNA2_/TRDRNA2_40091_c0_seq1.p1  ORF type:complete len:112 (+),score=12.92 gnl/TRDRNA2_/TRDRNA2_40091_c0_seq1:267-602(+)
MAKSITDAPGAWDTAVFLPENPEIRILEAWYGHPSDETRRCDLTNRVQRLVNGEARNSGTVSLVSGKFYSGDKLCLRASPELWGVEDPCPWVWKKFLVRFKPPPSYRPRPS